MPTGTFQVVWSRQTSNGNWHTKLFCEEIQESVDQGDLFGTNDKMCQRTLFVFGSKQVTVATVVLDPALYRIKMIDYAIPTTGEVVQLSYLNGLK